MRSTPSSIIVPQDGSGARTPAPRNDSADSSSTALATSSGEEHEQVETRLGTTSVNMIRSGPAP